MKNHDLLRTIDKLNDFTQELMATIIASEAPVLVQMRDGMSVYVERYIDPDTSYCIGFVSKGGSHFWNFDGSSSTDSNFDLIEFDSGD